MQWREGERERKIWCSKGKRRRAHYLISLTWYNENRYEMHTIKKWKSKNSVYVGFEFAVEHSEHKRTDREKAGASGEVKGK